MTTYVLLIAGALLALVLTSTITTTSAFPPPPPPPGWGKQTLFDDFEGTSLNTSIWEQEVEIWRGGIYEASNVIVTNGELQLHTIAKNQTRNNTDFYVSSGAVNTLPSQYQLFGRWETRVILPDVNVTRGFTLHSSIWLVNVIPWEKCPGKTKIPEIDIIEYDPGYGSPGGRGHFHAFWDDNCTSSWTPWYMSWNQTSTQAQGFSTDWHIFGLSWTPTRISMDVDGITVMVVDASHGEESARYLAGISLDPMEFLLTSCVMLDKPLIDGDVLPQVYRIDWVRAFEWVNNTGGL